MLYVLSQTIIPYYKGVKLIRFDVVITLFRYVTGYYIKLHISDKDVPMALDNMVWGFFRICYRNETKKSVCVKPSRWFLR